MAIADFWKFIQGKLRGGKTLEVTADDITEYINREEWKRLAIFEFALHSGINIIANAL